MARTLQEVDNALASAEARLAAVDGVGLSPSEVARLTDLQKKINGLKSTISQVALSIQAQLTELSKAVAALDARINQHINPELNV